MPQRDTIGIRAIRYELPDTTADLAAAEDRGLLESPAAVLAEFGFRRIHISARPGHDLARDALQYLLDDEAIEALQSMNQVRAAETLTNLKGLLED